MIDSINAGNPANGRESDKPLTDNDKAMMRADECMEYLTVNPDAWPAAQAYATDCMLNGRRIETHALVMAVKDAVGDGSPFSFNNNHAPFLRRLLAADNHVLYDYLELRGSMYDGLDVDRCVRILRNKHRNGGATD